MIEIDACFFWDLSREPALEKVMMLRSCQERNITRQASDCSSEQKVAWVFLSWETLEREKTTLACEVPYIARKQSALKLKTNRRNLNLTQETCSGECYDITLLASDCSSEQKVAWVFLSWVTLEQDFRQQSSDNAIVILAVY